MGHSDLVTGHVEQTTKRSGGERLLNGLDWAVTFLIALFVASALLTLFHIAFRVQSARGQEHVVEWDGVTAESLESFLAVGGWTRLPGAEDPTCTANGAVFGGQYLHEASHNISPPICFDAREQFHVSSATAWCARIGMDLLDFGIYLRCIPKHEKSHL